MGDNMGLHIKFTDKTRKALYKLFARWGINQNEVNEIMEPLAQVIYGGNIERRKFERRLGKESKCFIGVMGNSNVMIDYHSKTDSEYYVWHGISDQSVPKDVVRANKRVTDRRVK